MYGALAVQGKEFSQLAKQRIVLVGAGSAGMGVARMLALGMVKQVLLSCPQPCLTSLSSCSQICKYFALESLYPDSPSSALYTVINSVNIACA